MRLHPWSALVLLAIPLASAAVAPHQDSHRARDAVHRRQGGLFDDETTTNRGGGGSSTQQTSNTGGQNTGTQTTRDQTTTSNTPTTTQPTTTPSPTTNPPTTTPTTTQLTTSRTVRTNDEGETVTEVVTVPASPPSTSATQTNTPNDNNNDSSGPGKGTYIGLGVAGGVAALAVVGFLIWKFTNKRFSQFDNDDGNDIKWPQPKEELVTRPVAPAMSGAASMTNSSVDLTRDPYAVPPLPPHNTASYYDDPSGTAAAAYYDPYRGPVPQTFQSNSPPESIDSHAHPYPPGEAIPMNTYPSSGRQSPGPGVGLGYGNDPYARSQSPGPNAAYGNDPYAGRRSPGPMMAYGAGPMDPTGRIGTPLQRVGTPGGVSYGAPTPQPDLMRTGTPLAYGRASPGPAMAYGAPPMDPYGRHTPNPYGQ